MNFVERTAVKLAWKRMEGKMPQKLKRWLPLLGTVVLIGAVVAQVTGHADLARNILGLAGMVGLDQQSAVPVGELLAAGTALAGVVMKITSQVRKARDAKDVVSLK